MKIAQLKPLPDAAGQAVRNAVVAKVEANPEHYLSEYTRQFGNILNADNAATLFPEYNEDPARYRAAVHPAAQWIRDELFRRVLKTTAIEGKNRVVFTAGGNAAGKSTAIAVAGAAEGSHVVLDSTFSNAAHARRLIGDALTAGKAISILYINRPLGDALEAMIERAGSDGRIVTIEQLIESQRGAAETVGGLWEDFEQDPRFTFTFLYNSAEGHTNETGVEGGSRGTTLKAAETSMNSSTLNTRVAESPKPRTEELGDADENEANRRQARLMAARAVEGLNRLREQKNAARTAKAVKKTV